MLAFLCVPWKQECNADRDKVRVNIYIYIYICLHVIVCNFASIPGYSFVGLKFHIIVHYVRVTEKAKWLW